MGNAAMTGGVLLASTGFILLYLSVKA